jgi:hypothetical protein
MDGERGEHFAPSFPEVMVVLHHAKKKLEFFDICGRLNCKYCLHLITLGFNAISCQYVTPRYSISSVQNVNFSVLTFKPASQRRLSTSSSFLRWSSRLLLETQRRSSK